MPCQFNLTETMPPDPVFHKRSKRIALFGSHSESAAKVSKVIQNAVQPTRKKIKFDEWSRTTTAMPPEAYPAILGEYSVSKPAEAKVKLKPGYYMGCKDAFSTGFISTYFC